MEFYVLDEDQVEAQQLHKSIVTKLKEMNRFYEEACFHLASNNIEYLICLDKAEKARQQMLTAQRKLDELQSKRVHKERFDRLVKELVEKNISVVKVRRL